MIFEGLLSDDDSITLIQSSGETSHFQNADNTCLSVSNELDISNNQFFSSAESCYLSDSEIEINLTGSYEEGKSSDREQSEKLQQDLASWACYNRCSKSCLDELLNTANTCNTAEVWLCSSKRCKNTAENTNFC